MFKYLGAKLNEKCHDDDEEIKASAGLENVFVKTFLARGKVSFNTLDESHTLLYLGHSAWSLKVKSKNCLESCEMWVLRRLLKIPWTPKRARVEKELLKVISRTHSPRRKIRPAEADHDRKHRGVKRN